MSVEYYSCDCCKDTVYEEFIGTCTKCGHKICTSCIVNNDIQSNYADDYELRFDGSEEQKKKYDIKSIEEDPDNGYKIGEPIEDTSIDPKYCPFCQKEIVSEEDLLNFALDKLKMTKRSIKRRV